MPPRASSRSVAKAEKAKAKDTDVIDLTLESDDEVIPVKSELNGRQDDASQVSISCLALVELYRIRTDYFCSFDQFRTF